jgi:hypothetical protein
VTISGWVGVIIEKIITDYLERFATDIVAVNSRSELATFETVARNLQLSTDNLLLQRLAATVRSAPRGTGRYPYQRP